MPKLVIDNTRIVVESPSRRFFSTLDDRTSFFVEGFYFADAYKDGFWDGREHLFHKLRGRDGNWYSGPVGLLDEVLKIAARDEIEFEVEDLRRRPSTLHTVETVWNPEFVLRSEYQIPAVEAALQERGPNGLLTGKGILNIATRGGKCLGPDVPVLMYDGSIKIAGEVKVGDMLMGPDSRPRNVISTTVGHGPMFRICGNKRSSWTCNDVHVLTLVRTDTDEVIDIPLNEYMEAGSSFKRLYKLFAPAVGVDFAPIGPCRVDPYWLGVWFGDGTKSLKGVAVSKSDPEIESACNEVAATWGCSVRIDGVKADGSGCKTYHLVTPRGQPNFLLIALRELVGPDVRVPSSILYGSRQTRRDFLAGFLDTDGYLHRTSMEIVQRRADYADAVAFIARSLGFRAYMSDKFVKGQRYIRVSISGDTDQIPLRVQRKSPPPRTSKVVATRAGFTVESIGIGPYAGFEVDGDGRFLLGDFTVTHNTVIAAAIIHRLRCRTLFLVGSEMLMRQTCSLFERVLGVKPGKVGAGVWDEGPITVASLQTLIRHVGKTDEWEQMKNAYDFVFFDEVHHTNGAKWREVLEKLDAFYKIGLSATIFLGKKKETPKGTIWIRGSVGPILYSITPSELIDLGYLVAPEIVMNPVLGPRVQALDWNVIYDLGIVRHAPRNRRIVERAKLRHEQGMQVVITVRLIEHVTILTDMLRETGLRVGVITGTTPPSRRETVVKLFEKRQLDVLIGTVFGEAVDIPIIESVIVADGGKSAIATTQRFRNLTPSPGKERAVLDDFADMHHWKLAEHSEKRVKTYVSHGAFRVTVDPTPVE